MFWVFSQKYFFRSDSKARPPPPPQPLGPAVWEAGCSPGEGGEGTGSALHQPSQGRPGQVSSLLHQPHSPRSTAHRARTTTRTILQAHPGPPQPGAQPVPHGASVTGRVAVGTTLTAIPQAPRAGFSGQAHGRPHPFAITEVQPLHTAFPTVSCLSKVYVAQFKQ